MSVIASTGIPDEMNAIGLVEFISLEDGEKVWAEKIIEKAKQPKVDTIEKIKKARYESTR